MKPTLFLLLAVSAAAQSSSDPPNLIRIHRSACASADPIRRYVQANAQLTVLGLKALAGASESWLIETHNSFASLEDLDKKLPNDTVDPACAPAQSWIGVYRPGWSYLPDQAVRLMPKARYWLASIYRTAPGAEGEFRDLIRARKLNHDRVNLDRPDIAYQILFGAAGPTYLILAPLTSLQPLDTALPTYVEPVVDSKTGKRTGEGDISREYLILRTDARSSYVSDDWAGTDADFWHPKQK